MRGHRGAWRGLTLLLAVWVARPAFSEEPTTGAGTPTARSARLKSLRVLLDSEHRASKVWTWTWVGVYGAVTVGQVVPIPFIADPGTRTDFWVGSVSSLIGALGLALLPLNLPSGADLPADPEAALVEAERRLRIGAEQERLGTAWFTHAANAGVNLIIGLVLGLGYGHWESGALSFGIGFAVGELTLLTQPTRLIQAEKAETASVDLQEHAFRLAPTLNAHGGGLAVSFIW